MTDAWHRPDIPPTLTGYVLLTVTWHQAQNGTTNPTEGVTVDRSEISRALAKAIAFKQCGKDDQAAVWARQLVTLLECAEILAP